MQAAYRSAVSLVRDVGGEDERGGHAPLARISHQRVAGDRLALGRLAAERGLRGAPRAELRRLVDLAWGDGAMLAVREANELGWEHLAAPLLFCDELERAVEICDAALALARNSGLTFACSTASYCKTSRCMS